MCVFLICLFIVLCLFCFAFPCFQVCRMFLYRLITSIANITTHKTKTHVYVFVVACCCLCCVFLCLFMFLCLFCFAFFSCVQLCRMFLYRLITNITYQNTQQKTCLYMLWFDVVCAVCVCVVCSCVCVCFVLLFLFPTRPHVLYRLITNITNITKHKTCVCCCLLLVVLFVFVALIVHCSVFVLFCFLVSNYAACSFIG